MKTQSNSPAGIGCPAATCYALPCPFCGFEEPDKRPGAMSCPNCGAQGPDDIEAWGLESDDRPLTSLQAWNRRTASPGVLDACCGPRMMWFDNSDTRAIYMDRREQVVKGAWGPASAGRKDVVIKPDILADFTEIPFPDGSFFHVVFDPPHIQRMEATGKVSQTFGVLTPGWEEMLAKGFRECFRVLKPGGTLIFKWCEVEVPLARVLALTPEKPLYGHRSGKKAQTHWVAFLKQNAKGDSQSPAKNL